MYTLSDQYGYEVLIITSYYNQESGEILLELDESNKQFIVDTLVEYLDEYSPNYLGFGVEVNTLAKSNPEGFTEFVSFYDIRYVVVAPGVPV